MTETTLGLTSAQVTCADEAEVQELFLRNGEEVLVARDGQDVAGHLRELTPERARRMGEAARARVLAEHTYARRGAAVDALLQEEAARKRARSAA